MKFGDEAGAGKESVPGHPVVFRRVHGDGPVGVIAQIDEAPPPGYARLTDGAPIGTPADLRDARVVLSGATRAIANGLRQARLPGGERGEA